VQLVPLGNMANPAAQQAQSRFLITADSVWKRTRLAPARVTLTPGQWTPAPATPAQNMGMGMGMGMGMSGLPPGEGMNQ